MDRGADGRAPRARCRGQAERARGAGEAGGNRDRRGGGGGGGLADFGGRIRGEQVGGKCASGARTSSSSLFFFFCAIFFSDLDYSDSLVGPQRAPFEWPNGAFFRNFEWGFAIIFYLFFHKITKIDDASKISQNYTITDMSHGGREL